MQFDLSDDQQLLRQSTRDFLAAEAPVEKTRRAMEDDPRGIEESLWRQVAEMGYVGLLLPAGVGGQGLGALELAVVLEEAGRVCLPGPLLDVVLAASVLAEAGGQEALLREVAAGTARVVIAREDAAFAGEAPTRTMLAGGRVKGTKHFVPFAASADALVVTTPDGPCLVRGPFPVTPTPTLDHAQRFATVTLDHPATRLGGPALLEPADRLAAVGAGAMLLGLMTKAFEMSHAYVQTREAFKRPIGTFQVIQHRLADMLMRVESTRSAVYRAAWCVDADDEATGLACASAKAYAGDAGRFVCGEAIQVHGGIGFTWELDLHWYFKRTKTLEQHYGSTEERLEAALAAVGY